MSKDPEVIELRKKLKKVKDDLRRVMTTRNALLAILNKMQLDLHPDNPNDGGAPCVCNRCEVNRQAKVAIAEAERGAK